MSAVEELRRMLDERGVEYTRAMAAKGTLFIVVTSKKYYFILVRDNDAGIEMWSRDLTPAQAIAATLGPQIVRCKDCKHFTHNKEFWIEPPKVPFPIIGVTSDCCDFWADTECKVEPDGFCAWGERKVVES